ncbi:hypothetical protein GGS23DRAFT_466452 [Durotheca rogersii]|uniref:uncharacterized protein n=1 Tax=Durotheca rogersii TaxID=419775 RepID=UPI00221EB435|nr:uncharacterized protein GGS23DRAFT_466452 [Durotheca rogersii]KAI5864852.1 hypothetical protein GGS23DRAFT_466452 [Durotheca rogersii]
MAGVIEAIGIISGLLGIVQFGIDNFADPKTVGSTIRITVGLDTKGGLNNAGGDLPDVRLWNEAGDFLGIKADPGKVEHGGFKDITINHKRDSTQQPTYTLFSANNDAICIAAASITWPNGDKYSWVGDWGRQCGASWYFSNVFISGTNVKPDCMWIDGNNDQPQTGFQIHWPEFVDRDGNQVPADEEGKLAKMDYLCTAGPPFKLHNFPDKDPRGITYWVINNNKKRSDSADSDGEVDIAYGPAKHPSSARFRNNLSSFAARSNGTTNAWANRLVLDNSATHPARALCESETSAGPDFLNVEDGTFCRMSDKTLWAICGTPGADAANCFDKDAMRLVVGGLAARDSPYENVVDWTAGAN